MKKSSIVLAIAAAMSLSAGAAYAADEAGDAHMKMNDKNNPNNEKCMVVKDGKGLIKASKADCATESHSCAGSNKEGDAKSWIYVPKGQCAKINAGDMTGVSDEVKAKIEAAPAKPAEKM
jgi:uncharacterized membrane protein